MKTSMQELIEQVEQWMLDDKHVQDNPLDYEEYMVHYANQMIEVKSKFIEMCKSMLDVEKDTFIHFGDRISYLNYGDEYDSNLVWNEMFNT